MSNRRRSQVDNDAPTVAICVVSYGRPSDIVNCVGSVAASTYRDFEAIVVENAGPAAFDRLVQALESSRLVERKADETRHDCGSAEMWALSFRRWAAFRLIAGGQSVLILEAQTNLGFAGAVNAVLSIMLADKAWRGCWLLNPDCEIDSHALAALVAKADSDEYGVVGSRLVSYDRRSIQLRGGKWRRWLARPLAIGRGEPHDSPADILAVERAMDWVSGASCYATRRFIEQVGPLYEGFFLYCEDVDWCLRKGAFRLGYAHDSIVYHVEGASTGAGLRFKARSAELVFLRERNKLLLSRRHFPNSFPMMALIALVLSFEYLFRGTPSQFWAALKGWLAGMRGEVGRPTVGHYSASIDGARTPAAFVPDK